MNVLLPLLIVAIGPDVPIEVRYPEAATVFHCTFGESWDENFDGWPDKWWRRKGPDFPRYIQVKINQEPSPAGQRCLRIELDGGAAVAYSPPIKVGSLFAYVLEGYLKTEGLKYDRAYFSVTLLDAQRHRLQSFYSQKIGQSGGWKKLRLGPILSETEDVRLAIIGLHVQPEPRQDLKEDLHGAVTFDDVWLGRLPRMTLTSNDPYHFFTTADKQPVEITCTASGLLPKDPRVTFQLEDVLGRELARSLNRLEVTAAVGDAELSLDSFSEESAGQIGRASWEPPIPGPGFYRLRATMKGRQTLVHRRKLELVVIDPCHAAAGGEFGWSLPRGERPLPLPALSRLVGQAGINWLKYPLWCQQLDSRDTVDRLTAFGERLSAQGIELIGLLHQPPEALRARYGQGESLSAAYLFSPDPKVWYPSLEPVMARLATQVRWWQLGDDKDTSFVAYPRLAEKIAQVKSEMDRIGQDVNLALGWGWIHQLPQAAHRRPPWRAVSLSADPPLTHRELGTYLDASKDLQSLRWVVVEPLSVDYPLEVRATDLVRRMIAAKIHGADAIFCPQPFGTRQGLFSDEGTPGELFLPWRTAALALAGAQYIGSIELPGGSPNQIFSRASDAVMIVWNEHPVEEVLYLGEDVRQIDLWGRSVTPEGRGHRQVIQAGRLPTFVTGLSEPIARWRMDFSLQRKRIPSIFGRPHQNSFTMKNHFQRGAGGQAELVTPQVWIVDCKRTSFRLAGGEEMRYPFEIILPYNASSGRHKVRADFQIEGDRPYKFSVFRQMDVGLGDVFVEIVTQLNDRGELEVHQQFVNETDARVSFSCQLFAPDRRRIKSRVFDLGRGTDVKIYRLPEGKQLLGKTLWLRAEEMDGPRNLNYRFVAEQ